MDGRDGDQRSGADRKPFTGTLAATVLVVALAIGSSLGWAIDRTLVSSPWATVIGAAVCILAGLCWVAKAAR